MTMGRLLGPGLLACAMACAQTFPAEFRTDDATLVTRMMYFAQQMTDHNRSLMSEFPRLIALPANRVYTQMDSAARVAALKTALPLVKQLAMSDAVRKKHDETIAQVYGAVDHGLKVPPAMPDPEKRLKAMTDQLQKNPMVASNPKFMQEFTALQQEIVVQSTQAALDPALTIFTRPLAQLKRDTEQAKAGASSNPGLAKCYEGALALAASDEQRFRLQAYRCELMNYGAEKTEAEADKLRKERAQKLYNEKCMEGVLRRTLAQLLETAATVDFNAQTTVRSGRQVFVDQALQNKDNLWKLIYRNGKEPTEVTVQFAKAWLAELTPPPPAPAPGAAKPASAVKAAPAKAAPKK
jgi:hypothetical protein